MALFFLVVGFSLDLQRLIYSCVFTGIMLSIGLVLGSLQSIRRPYITHKLIARMKFFELMNLSLTLFIYFVLGYFLFLPIGKFNLYPETLWLPVTFLDVHVHAVPSSEHVSVFWKWRWLMWGKPFSWNRPKYQTKWRMTKKKCIIRISKVL
jgi:hypothetical protein